VVTALYLFLHFPDKISGLSYGWGGYRITWSS
jgi:hypothetical protein